jgi:hypothetical protein
MTDDLSLATRITQLDATTFAQEVPLGWEQGRGAYGGLVVGAMARAAIASEPELERTLRAVSLEIVGPVQPGRALLRTELLRRGNGVTAIDVRLVQRLPGPDGREHDALQARGTFTLARTRTTDVQLAPAEPPTMPAFDTLPRAPVGPPLGPVFTQHFDFRVTGPAPFSGATEPRVEGWIHAPGASAWGPPEWLAMVDCYWPSPWSMAPAPRPAVTLTYTAHVVAEAPRGPLFYRARAVGGRDGFVSEVRELFAPDGTLVLVNPQVIAIVK